MAPKISPNRRRSIAVLGPSSSKTIQKRRRTYSMVPGEKLSPAARARKLAPRKSILKGSLPNPLGQDSSQTSVLTTEENASNNVTMSMDMTELLKPSRKSLARRVSFASHAHVRLMYKKDKKDGDSSRDEDEYEVEEERARGDERSKRRQSDSRRRSSLGFGDDGYGEQSMEMDEDDTGPIPQTFLGGPSLDDEMPEFSDEEEYGEDMDMTGIPGHNRQKRKSSLGFRESLPGLPHRRRSSIATSSQSHSENQPYRPKPRQDPQDLGFAESNREPSPVVDHEDDDYDDATARHARFADPNENVTIATQSDMDVTTSSMMDPTTSSNADSTQPVEFTIPVIRPPPPPDEQWLKLRAMTHAGADEPYEPPEMEPLDDPEANIIVPSEPYWDEENSMPRHHVLTQEGDSEEDVPAEGDSGMDLTDALTRLAKARPSLGLPPLPDDATQSFSLPQDEAQDETFTSTEDSFGGDGDMSLDGNQTLNITKIRMSMGGRSSASMELTRVYRDAESQDNAQIPEARISPPQAVSSQSTEQQQPPSVRQPLQQVALPASGPSVFSARPSVFSAPAASTSSSTTPPSVFSAPRRSTTTPPGPSPPTSAPEKPSQPSQIPRSPAKPSQIPRSPAKPAAPTVPKPFTFTVPARLANDSPARRTPAAPASPSKLPVFRGTAAFAPPSAPKSPRKRPLPADAAANAAAAPSPAKKQAVASAAQRPVPEPAQSQGQGQLGRRASVGPAVGGSAMRRPSGYFAQRRSLGGAAAGGLSAAGTAPLARSVSMPVVASQERRESAVGAQEAEGENARLYPDLSRVEEETRATSPQPRERLYPDLSRIEEEETQSTSVLSRPQSPSLPAETESRPASSPSEQTQTQVAGPTPSPVSSSSAQPSPLAGRRTSLAPAQRRESVLPPPSLAQQRRQSTVTPPQRPASPAAKAPIGNAEKGKAPAKTLTFAEDDTVQSDAGGAGRTMAQTQQWREGVAEDFDEDSEPTISIEQFFEMTNIRFMDEITAPRRSTVHPAHLRPHNRRRSLASSAHGDAAAGADAVPLAEFMTAMSIEVPQLELYSVLAEELGGWIEESKKICRLAEEDALKMTPALFTEFAMADEVGKQDLLHQLKIIKANTIGGAKSQWYDWKSEWVGRLQESAEEAFAGLESDAKFLEKVINQAQTMLPALRAEYAQVMEELEKEEAAVAELEKSDKDYLNELKVSIAEQDTEIQAFRANVSEAEAKLQRLKEKDAEIEAEKQELTTAIAQAQRIIHINTESTSSEVFRLKNELETLEDLHLWRCTKISPALLEFIYAARFDVSVPCTNHVPVLAKLTVRKRKDFEQRERDAFPALTELMVARAPHAVAGAASMHAVIQRLGGFWAACTQLRQQLAFLRIKYPLDVDAVPAEGAPPTLRARATVLFPAVKSKVYVSYIFDWETYSRWPLSIRSIKWDVKVAYGAIDRQKVLDAISDRLSQATPYVNHGCLLDACIEATEQFA